jgi:virginiamycin A acetyltransferase
MKGLAKRAFAGICLIAVFPLAVLAGFGRIRPLYIVGAHAMALGPGVIGDYFRAAYYHLTLKSCSLWCRVSFGAILSNPESTIEDGVYIGPYSILGKVRIGRRTQIASLAQVLSGARQHARDEQGNITGSDQGHFSLVSIGEDCWIGAGAIVMADVGAGATIGAGAIVTKSIPGGVVAVGNPARVLAATQQSSQSS